MEDIIIFFGIFQTLWIIAPSDSTFYDQRRTSPWSSQWIAKISFTHSSARVIESFKRFNEQHYWINIIILNTVFENDSKYRIFNFWILAFPLIFGWLKVTCLVTLFGKLQVFKNSLNWLFLAFNANFCIYILTFLVTLFNSKL